MRTFRLYVVGTVIFALLAGPGGVALSQEATEERQTVNGQAIAEMVNEAINGCDVVECDAAPFEEVYDPDIQIIVDDEVLAEGLEALRAGFRLISNHYRLITPVAEYPTSDGDLYVAQWVEVTGPGHPTGDPILSVMQVRDGKVVRQYDTTPPFSWAARATD